MVLALAQTSLGLFSLGMAAYLSWLWWQSRLPPLHALRQFLAPPQFPDERETRQAGLLHGIIQPLFVIVAVSAALVAWRSDPVSSRYVLVLAGWTEAALAALYVLMRRGEVRLASRLFLLTLTVTATWGMVILGGTASPATSGYLLVIVVAGLLSGGRAALGAAGVCALLLFAAAGAEAGGLLYRDQPVAPLTRWLAYTSVFALTAVLLRLAARRMQESLEQAIRLRVLQAEQTHEISLSLEAERKRARQTELLADLARRLHGLTDPQALMDEAARRVCEGFNYEHAAIFLVEGDDLVLRAAHGLLAPSLAPGLRLPGGEEVVSQVARTGEARWVRDADSELRFTAKSGAAVACAVVAPLRLGKHTVGVLNVESIRPDAFDESDVRTLESVADLTVAGLQASQLFLTLRGRQQLTEALRRIGAAVNASLDLRAVLAEVAAQSCAAFQAGRVEVWLLDDAGAAALAAAHGWPEPLVADPAALARTAQLGQVLVAAAAHGQPAGPLAPGYSPGLKSLLVVPLLKDQHPYGALVLGEAERERAFSAEEAASAELLGAQLAAAIQNARLYNDHRRRAEQLALLNDITRASLAIADFDLLLETLAERLGELIGADGCYLLLWDDARQFLIPATASRTLRSAALTAHFSLHPGFLSLADNVLQSGSAVAIHDLAASAYFERDPAGDTLADSRSRAVLGLPLAAGGQKLGVALITFSRPRMLPAEDVAYAEQAARHIALALARARALQAERQRNAELETLRQASLRLTSTLDLREVLESILQQTLRLADAMDAHIFLYDGETLTFGAALWADGSGRKPFTQPRRGGITETVARTGERIVVPDTNHHPLFADWKWGGAIVGLPLRMSNRVCGVMNVAFERPRTFAEHELRVLELLGDQAAVALENARLFQAERRRAAQLALLSEVSQQIADTLEESVLLPRVVSAMVNRLGFAGASVMVPVGDDELEVVAIAKNEAMAASVGFRQKVGEGVIGHAAEIRQTYLTNDVSRDPYYFDPGGRAVGSAIALPLMRENRLLGVLYLESSEIGTFSQPDVEALETLAHHVATALENARLYAGARDRLRDMLALQQLSQTVASSLDLDYVIETVVNLLHDTFDYQYVSLYRLEGQVLRLQYQVGYPPERIIHIIPVDQGVSGRAVRTRQPQFVQDAGRDPDFLEAARDVEYEICVPLLKEQTVLGTLNIEAGAGRPLTDADVSLLTALAGQVTVAMENARLFTGERVQRELAEALHDASVSLSASLDFDTVLDRLLDQIGRVVPYDAANVMLLDKATGRARVARQRGYDRFGSQVAEDAASIEFDAATTPNLAHMQHTGQPLIIPDTAHYPGWRPVAATAHVRSWAGAPILALGEVIAFFSLDKVEPDFYQPEHAARLSAFAGQAALALQNARLFEAQQRRAEELRLLWSASRDFSSGLSQDAVLDAIVRHMTVALRTAGCTVSLWDSGNNRVVTLHDYMAPGQTGRLVPPGTTFDLNDYPATLAVLKQRQPMIVDVNDPRADPAERDLLLRYGHITSLVLPLGTGADVFGLIELFRDPGMPAFSESDLQLAQSLGAQAAVALENVRLHSALQDNVRELDALLKANEALLSTLELQPLLHNILQAAAAAIPAAEKGVIILADPAAEQLQVRAALGYADERVESLDYGWDKGYAGQVIRSREPLLIEDTRAEPRSWFDGGLDEVAAVRSAILAPLAPKREAATAMGLISLHATQPRAFTQADLRRLVAFANTAAVAIENARLHSEVQRLAVTDSLTGLANPRAFEQALTTEVHRAARYGYSVSLIIMDIDSFKQYNDTYGHPAGNERLKAIADVLRAAVRDPDLPVRYGGEEFALLLPHTSKPGAVILAERIRELAEAAAPRPGRAGQPISGYTLSLGVANFPSDATSAQALLLAADNAELAAKRAGKNRVCQAPPLPAIVPSNGGDGTGT